MYICLPREVLKPPTSDSVRATAILGSIFVCTDLWTYLFPMHTSFSLNCKNSRGMEMVRWLNQGRVTAVVVIEMFATFIYRSGLRRGGYGVG